MSKDDSRIRIVGENLDVAQVNTSFLTTDCYGISYIPAMSEDKRKRTDIVRGKRVDIFDFYYDRGNTVLNIFHIGGRKNPKISTPEIKFK